MCESTAKGTAHICFTQLSWVRCQIVVLLEKWRGSRIVHVAPVLSIHSLGGFCRHLIRRELLHHFQPPRADLMPDFKCQDHHVRQCINKSSLLNCATA